jgi:hypothetical protein
MKQRACSSACRWALWQAGRHAQADAVKQALEGYVVHSACLETTGSAE